MERFIANSVQRGNPPLPILSALNNKKALYLIDYAINPGNAIALADSFDHLVPHELRKLTLIRNGLTDFSIAYIF